MNLHSYFPKSIVGAPFLLRPRGCSPGCPSLNSALIIVTYSLNIELRDILQLINRGTIEFHQIPVFILSQFAAVHTPTLWLEYRDIWLT